MPKPRTHIKRYSVEISVTSDVTVMLNCKTRSQAETLSTTLARHVFGQRPVMIMTDKRTGARWVNDKGRWRNFP